MELDAAHEGRSTSESEGLEEAGEAVNRVVLEAPDACPEEDEVAIKASGTWETIFGPCSTSNAA